MSDNTAPEFTNEELTGIIMRQRKQIATLQRLVLSAVVMAMIALLFVLGYARALGQLTKIVHDKSQSKVVLDATPASLATVFWFVIGLVVVLTFLPAITGFVKKLIAKRVTSQRDREARRPVRTRPDDTSGTTRGTGDDRRRPSRINRPDDNNPPTLTMPTTAGSYTPPPAVSGLPEGY